MSKRKFDANNVTLLIETTAGGVNESDWGNETRGRFGSMVHKAGDEAINIAFETIERMATRTATLITELHKQQDQPKPASLEIEFGVSFNGELQAYIAKIGAEGTIHVKLSWDMKSP